MRDALIWRTRTSVVAMAMKPTISADIRSRSSSALTSAIPRSSVIRENVRRVTYMRLGTLLLARPDNLREAGRVHVHEHRRARRQQVEVEEVRVEFIAVGRLVEDRAGAVRSPLEGAGRLAAGEEGRQRSAEAHRVAGPVLEIAYLIVRAAVGAERLVGARRVREREALAAQDREAVIRQAAVARREVVRVDERLPVVPLRRQQRDGVGEERGRRRRIVEAPIGVRVPVALDVDGILGRDREAG